MLRSNYKWIISATPLQIPVINLYTIFKWFSGDMNNYLKNINFNEKSDIHKYLQYSKYTQCIDKCKNGCDDKCDNYNYFGNNYLYFKIKDTNIMSNIFSKIFRKTTKSDIKGQIDVPIFTEEVVYLKHTSLEKNIYLDAMRENNERKLFMLCTHILISTTGNEMLAEKMAISDKILTLEEINELMTKFYKKNQEKLQKENSNASTEIANHIQEELLSQQILKQLLDIYTYDVANSPYFVSQFGKSNIETQMRYGNWSIRTYKNNIIAFIKIIQNPIDISLICDSIKKDQVCNFKENEKAYLTIQIIRSAIQNNKASVKRLKEKCEKNMIEIKRLDHQIKLFGSNNYLKEALDDTCGICFMEYDDKVAVTKCRHIVCGSCIEILFSNTIELPCPYCRTLLNKMGDDIKITTVVEILGKSNKIEENDTVKTEENIEEKTKEEFHLELVSKYGTKLSYLIEKLTSIFENKENRVIIFSQYDKMLTMVGQVLDENKIKHLYLKGNVHVVNRNILKFKEDDSYKVIMLSSEKANSGCNLTEANYVIQIDVIHADKQRTWEIESQAIGRAIRLGQNKPVKVMRIIMKDTIEDTYYNNNKYDMSLMQFQ
jgi:SNF2 family DNA or RNA helicase